MLGLFISAFHQSFSSWLALKLGVNMWCTLIIYMGVEGMGVAWRWDLMSDAIS